MPWASLRPIHAVAEGDGEERITRLQDVFAAGNGCEYAVVVADVGVADVVAGVVFTTFVTCTTALVAGAATVSVTIGSGGGGRSGFETQGELPESVKVCPGMGKNSQS